MKWNHIWIYCAQNVTYFIWEWQNVLFIFIFIFLLAWHKHAPGVSFQKIELRKELSHYRIADEFVAELVIFTTTTFYTRPVKTLYVVQKSRRRRRRSKSVFSRLWFHYIFISTKNRYFCQPASNENTNHTQSSFSSARWLSTMF